MDSASSMRSTTRRPVPPGLGDISLLSRSSYASLSGGPGHRTLGCLRSPTMRSMRWWRNISDLPGAPAKAPRRSELTASRMCWPGLALAFRSSSSSRESRTC